MDGRREPSRGKFWTGQGPRRKPKDYVEELIRITEIGLDYIVDPSMWLKQQGGVGQSSGAPPALTCPGTLYITLKE